MNKNRNSVFIAPTTCKFLELSESCTMSDEVNNSDLGHHSVGTQDQAPMGIDLYRLGTRFYNTKSYNQAFDLYWLGIKLFPVCIERYGIRGREEALWGRKTLLKLLIQENLGEEPCLEKPVFYAARE